MEMSVVAVESEHDDFIVEPNDSGVAIADDEGKVINQ